MGIKLTVIGAREASAAIGAVAQSIAGHQLLLAVKAGAAIVQMAAKEKVPRRTSTLMRSIIVGEEEVKATAASVRVGPSEPYGKHVEYGTGIYAEGGKGRQTPWRFKTGDGSWVTTRGQRPQPFMRPAWDENQDKAIAEIKDILAELVNKAAQ